MLWRRLDSLLFTLKSWYSSLRFITSNSLVLIIILSRARCIYNLCCLRSTTHCNFSTINSKTFMLIVIASRTWYILWFKIILSWGHCKWRRFVHIVIIILTRPRIWVSCWSILIWAILLYSHTVRYIML